MLETIKDKLISGPIAIDLETKDPLLKSHYPAWIHPSLDGHIAGICIATADEEWYIPIGHEDGINVYEVCDACGCVFDTRIIYGRSYTDGKYVCGDCGEKGHARCDAGHSNEYPNYEPSRTLKILDEILNTGSHPVIFFNAHYDYGWLKGRHGIRITRPIYDGIIGAPLLNEHLRNYSLNGLAKYYGFGKGKDETVLEQEAINRYGATDKNYKSYIWHLPPEYVADYGKQDARLTYKLWEYQLPRLKEEQLMTVLQLELDLIECLIDVRLHGVRVDVPKIAKLKKKYSEKLSWHLNELSKIAGCKVVLNGGEQKQFMKEYPGRPCISAGSAKQMAQLCDRLGAPYNRTKTGQPSFAEDNILDECSYIAAHIVKAKRYGNKVLKTYIQGYIEHYLIGDRLHPQYNQLRSDDGGTITGRFSCCSPNLQNIPARDEEIGPDLMSLFIPDEGKVFIGMDYQAQEPRMAIHIAADLGQKYGTDVVPGSDMAMSPKFQSKDSDFHTEVSTAVIQNMWSNNSQEEYYKTLSWYRELTDTQMNFVDWLVKCFRTPAKEIGLGTMYSMGPATLKEKLEAKKIYLTKGQVKELQAAIYEAVPFLKTIDDYCKREISQRGYIKTVLWRRCRLKGKEVPEFFKTLNENGEEKWSVKRHLFSNDAQARAWRSKALLEGRQVGNIQWQDEYKALNKKIQGSSADQSKAAVLKTWRAGIIPQIFVHDAQVQSIDPSQRDLSVEIMETALPLKVPAKAGAKLGNNWKEVK